MKNMDKNEVYTAVVRQEALLPDFTRGCDAYMLAQSEIIASAMNEKIIYGDGDEVTLLGQKFIVRGRPPMTQNLLRSATRLLVEEFGSFLR